MQPALGKPKPCGPERRQVLARASSCAWKIRRSLQFLQLLNFAPAWSATLPSAPFLAYRLPPADDRTSLPQTVLNCSTAKNGTQPLSSWAINVSRTDIPPHYTRQSVATYPAQVFLVDSPEG